MALCYVSVEVRLWIEQSLIGERFCTGGGLLRRLAASGQDARHEPRLGPSAERFVPPRAWRVSSAPAPRFALGFGGLGSLDKVRPSEAPLEACTAIFSVSEYELIFVFGADEWEAA